MGGGLGGHFLFLFFLDVGGGGIGGWRGGVGWKSGGVRKVGGREGGSGGIWA